MIDSLRARLTLWYVGAFSVVLIVFSLAVFFLVSSILTGQMETGLRSALQDAVQEVSGFRPDAGNSLADRVDDPELPGQRIVVLDEAGRMLLQKPESSAVPSRFPTLHATQVPQFYRMGKSKEHAKDSCRGVYQRVVNGASGVTYSVVIITSDAELNDQLEALGNVLIATVVLALLVSGTGGWLLTRRSLLPLTAMAAATEHITASNLAKRVPVANPRDELGRLALSFNDLLSRLDTAFVQQRQFMADTSHELRTPLSIVRTSAQVALQKPQREESEYREALAMIEQQAQRLTGIVEDLFALARADMGQLPLAPGQLYLDEVVAEVGAASAVLGNQKRVRVIVTPAQESAYRGDEKLLRRMLLNLLDNAVRFTPAGGAVTLSLQRLPEAYRISVVDTGPGIPTEARPHIFERFFRGSGIYGDGQPAPSGAGLGLPIARTIAQLHGGDLKLETSGPDGSTFVVSLPWEP
jgi:heavy metal sensor kinase